MVQIRKKNRLGNWLYNNVWFFVTICIQDKVSYFWDLDVGADSIRLNLYWKIIEDCRSNISSIYKNVSLMDFVIMPNHIHGILFMDQEQNEAIDNRPYGLFHAAWLSSFKRQKSFYDHVIRNEQDLLRIQEYIELNPYKRKNDEYYIG